VGTSDARGCGANYTYDALGRVTSEDYSPCQAAHQPYSAPDFAALTGIETLYHYDTADADEPSIAASLQGCAFGSRFTVGRLVSVADRGAKVVSTFDARGRVTAVARRIAKPGAPSDALASRYADYRVAGNTASWFGRCFAFDLADRPVAT